MRRERVGIKEKITKNKSISSESFAEHTATDRSGKKTRKGKVTEDSTWRKKNNGLRCFYFFVFVFRFFVVLVTVALVLLVLVVLPVSFCSLAGFIVLVVTLEVEVRFTLGSPSSSCIGLNPWKIKMIKKIGGG